MTLLFLALVWLMGCGLVRAMVPAPVRLSIHHAWLAALGAGAGIGVASSLYFLTLAFAGPRLPVMAAVEGVALVAALACGILAKRGTVLNWAESPPIPWYLTAVLGIAAASALATFLFYAATKPHGEWDAWSIWNLRARFLFRAGPLWRDAFSTDLAWSHPDYPLMLPGIVAMCWSLARAESTLAPTAVAFLFTFGTVGVLISTVGILRGKMQAIIAGVLLLGSASMILNGANQYADIPIGYFMLATLGLLCIAERYPDDLRFTILAGLMAGFAAWTKNEGLLFVAAVIVARAWAIVRFGDRAVLTRQLVRLGAGLIAPLAVTVFFKLRFAPANDLVSRKPGQIVAHLADIGRWVGAIQGYVIAPFRIGNFLVPIILVLAAYWFFVRFKVDARDRASLATVLAAIGLTLAGEFAIYIAFTADMEWQINTSLERLLLQLWPSGLLAFFLAVNLPQLAAIPKEAEKRKPAKRAQKTSRA